MEELLRVGAVARVDPDPSAEIAAWEADLQVGNIDDPSETRRRLAAYARGDQVVVRLDLFAEVAVGDRVVRYDGVRLSGAWFEVGADDVNRAHAREMVAGELDRFGDELADRHGLEISSAHLHEMPLTIEIDDELGRRLASA